MKQASLCLALVLSLLLATSAAADLHVWWEGEQVGGTGEIFGDMGQTLELDCPVNQRCEWNLSMFISLDTPQDGVRMWAEDLLMNPAYAGIISIKDNSVPAGTPWDWQANAGLPNFGSYYGYYHLLLNASGQNSSLDFVRGPLTASVLTLTLCANLTPAMLGSEFSIVSEGGFPGWYAQDADSNLPHVDFFGNMEQLSVYSYGDIRANAPILIRAVPEPSTVAFLGIAALALIRRRR